MLIEVLLIGGYHNGKTIHIEDWKTEVKMPVPVTNHPGTGSFNSPDEEEEKTRLTYVDFPLIFVDQHEREHKYHIFRLSTITEKEAFDKMFEMAKAFKYD